MSKLLVLSDELHASMITYLKSCLDRYISAEEQGVEEFIEALETTPHGSDVVKAAKASGVTIVQFMSGFGGPKAGNRLAETAEDIYKHARGQGDDIEFDDVLIVDRVLDGAWVSSNVWVYSSDAGALDIADNIEAMCDFLKQKIEAFAKREPLLDATCDFLVDLVSDNPSSPFENLEPIEGNSPASMITLAGEPSAITPSGLIRDVATKAKELGYEPFQLEQLELWLEKYAVALDTGFHAVTEM